MNEREKQLRNCMAADQHQQSRFIVLPPSSGIDANWHVSNDGDTFVAHCFGFSHDVETGEGLARRIAAALNYCREIPTAHLLAHAANQSRRTEAAEQPSQPPARDSAVDPIMRLPAVLAAISVQKSTLYTMMKQGAFPRPARLGSRCVGWKQSTVQEWIERRSTQGRSSSGNAVVDQVADLFDAGLPVARIAARLGIGRATAYRYLKGSTTPR